MTLINLIPGEIMCASTQRVHLLRWALVVALAGAVCSIPYSLAFARKARVATLQEQVDQLDQEAAGVRAKLRVATGRTRQLFSELERSRALRAKRAWSGMFALIASSLPSDCWLKSVATDPDGPTGSGSRSPAGAGASSAAGLPETVTIEAPRRLRLTGFSTSDSHPLIFVQNLTDSKGFAKVGLQTILRAPADASGAVIYQFEILCEW